MTWAVDEKPWGKTQCLFNSGNVQVHTIKVCHSGYCSEHKHERKWNLIHVLSGKLQLKRWLANDEADTIVLLPGESVSIPPNVYHQFLALEDTQAVEIYWATADGNDINRRTVGGQL